MNKRVQNNAFISANLKLHRSLRFAHNAAVTAIKLLR